MAKDSHKQYAKFLLKGHGCDPIKLLQKQVKGQIFFFFFFTVCSHWLTPAVGDRKPLKPDFHFRGWSAEEGLEEGGVGRALPESRTEMMVAWLHGVDSEDGEKKVKSICPKRGGAE